MLLTARTRLLRAPILSFFTGTTRRGLPNWHGSSGRPCPAVSRIVRGFVTLETQNQEQATQIIELKKENVTLRTEFKTLEIEHKDLQARFAELHAAQQITTWTQMMTAMVNAHEANEQFGRANVAEGIHTNNIKINDVQNDISLLKSQNAEFRAENEALKERNAVLDQRNKTLEDRVSDLETKMLTIEQTFTTRDAMRDLEWFIVREALFDAGYSKREIKKKRLHRGYRNVKRKLPTLIFPAWVNEDIMEDIREYRKNGDAIAHVRPLTKDAVVTALADSDDDADDKALKALIVTKLTAYYTKEGKGFGVKPK